MQGRLVIVMLLRWKTLEDCGDLQKTNLLLSSHKSSIALCLNRVVAITENQVVIMIVTCGLVQEETVVGTHTESMLGPVIGAFVHRNLLSVT